MFADVVHRQDVRVIQRRQQLRFTRESPLFELGLSPRAAVDVVAAARCWALISGHTGVYPEDVQAVFAAVAGNRPRHRGELPFSHSNPASQVLLEVAIP